MANEVILTVTEEERQIARELSEYKYQLMVQGERAEAHQEGLAKGLAEGEQLGLAKGSYQAKRETARNLLQMGFSLDQITKATGLFEKEIVKL